MATDVPKYEEHVGETETPSIRVPANEPLEAFGGGRSQEQATNAIQGMEGEVGNLLEREKHDADILKVQDAYSKTIALKNELLWNPQTGFASRKNEDLLDKKKDLVGDYVRQYKDGIQKIQDDNLTNEDQRLAYAKIARQQFNHLDVNLNRQFAKKTFEAQEQGAKSTSDNIKNDIYHNYLDGNYIEGPGGPREKYIANWDKNADLRKYTGEERKSYMDTKLSEFNRTITQAAIDSGDNNYAKKYFYQHEDEFDRGDLHDLKSMLDVSEIRDEAYAAADKIISKHTGYSSQLKALKDLPSDIRDKATQIVDHNFEQHKRATDQYDKESFIKYYHKVRETGDRDSVPLNVEIRMSAARTKALDKAAEGADETDTDELNRLKNEFANNPKAFLNEDVYANEKLSSADKDIWFKNQLGLIKKDQTVIAKQSAYGSDTAETNSILLQNGYDPKDTSQGNIDTINRYKSAIDREVSAYEADPRNKGLPPNREERRQIKNRLMIEAAFDPSKMKWYELNPKKKLFEYKPGESPKVLQLRDIPEEYIIPLKKTLAKEGKPVSDKSMVDKFNELMLSQ